MADLGAIAIALIGPRGGRVNADEVRTKVQQAVNEGISPEKIVNYVREKYNIVVRTIGNQDAGTLAVRVSTPIYVTARDVENLVEGVRTLAAHRA